MNQEIDRLPNKLIQYLREQLSDPLIDYESPPTQLRGGFETYIYRFQLEGAPKKFSKPLVLRLYPEYFGRGGAVWESTVQNVLAAEGYPVAKAHMVCTDMSILGGAFFIMDFLPGKPLAAAPAENVPELLGKTHAALHDIDPNPLIKSLGEQGIDESMCFLNSRSKRLKDKGSEFPWLRDAIDWSIENRPPEPEHLVVCHGDFHPLNILVHDGQVSAVLDWPGFLVADPVLDVAITIVLTTIPYKHLSSTLELDIPSVDWELFAQQYLDAYQAEKPLDKTYLDYYRARRCVNALINGAEGQTAWQHPLIVKDLLEYIYSVTGIQITMPT